MTYAGESMILFLTNSSAYSISLIILILSLAYLLPDAKMLTTCQSRHGRGKRDSIPERDGKSDAGTLRFLNTGVGL